MSQHYQDLPLQLQHLLTTLALLPCLRSSVTPNLNQLLFLALYVCEQRLPILNAVALSDHKKSTNVTKQCYWTNPLCTIDLSFSFLRHICINY